MESHLEFLDQAALCNKTLWAHQLKSYQNFACIDIQKDASMHK